MVKSFIEAGRCGSRAPLFRQSDTPAEHNVWVIKPQLTLSDFNLGRVLNRGNCQRRIVSFVWLQSKRMDPRLQERRRRLADRDSDHSGSIFGDHDMFIVLKNLAKCDHTCRLL
jgi:hypothetical protein